MRKFIIIFVLSIFNQCISQQTPIVNYYLVLTDGIFTDSLFFGLDPSATNGIDAHLGESELPPIPPSGICDFRFIGTGINPPVTIGQGLKKDYRQGGLSTTGERIHRLKFQHGTGNYIRIFWNLPSNITGRLQDVILGNLIDTTFTGTGFYTIYNTAFNSLWFKVNYNSLNSVRNLIHLIPLKYAVYELYPNPFNSTANIKFDLPKNTFVTLKIFNNLGKLITTLVNESLNAGIYQVDWNASEYPSGVYFYRIETEDFTDTKRMVLVK